LVGRSQGGHTNVTLPLQFHHPGPPFLNLLRPASHPQNGLNFGQFVGHGEVTQTSRCLFSFVTRAWPFRPFYALWATSKIALNFGWSVGQSVSRLVGRLVGQSVSQLVSQSRGSHTNVTLPLQFLHLGPPFRPFYALRATPKTALNFGRLVGRSVGQSVGRSVGQGEVTQTSRCLFSSSVSSPGPALPDPSMPCEPPPKRP
jgi:hypothetical protein